MTEEQTEKIIQKNRELVTILDVASAIILDIVDEDNFLKRHKLLSDWFIEAIENVVYLDKPLPEMPREKNE